MHSRTGSRSHSSATRVPSQTPPDKASSQLAEFHAVVPAPCPACGGSFKDYNAQTVVSPPGVSLTFSPGLLSHLHICQKCGKKIFAPPRQNSGGA